MPLSGSSQLLHSIFGVMKVFGKCVFNERTARPCGGDGGGVSSVVQSATFVAANGGLLGVAMFLVIFGLVGVIDRISPVSVDGSAFCAMLLGTCDRKGSAGCSSAEGFPGSDILLGILDRNRVLGRLSTEGSADIDILLGSLECNEVDGRFSPASSIFVSTTRSICAAMFLGVFGRMGKQMVLILVNGSSGLVWRFGCG